MHKHIGSYINSTVQQKWALAFLSELNQRVSKNIWLPNMIQ